MLKHNVKSLSPIKIAGIILVILSLWMASGIFKHKTTTQPAKPVAKAKVVKSQAQLRNTSLRFNGVTKAHKGATLRPEVSGIVSKVIAHNGDFLKEGEVILKIDEENRKKLYQQAKSELESAKMQFAAARIVYEKQLSSKNNFVDATSKLNMAEAHFEKAKLELEKTNIKAPFDGYVDSINVKEGDYISNSIGSIICQFSSLEKLVAIIHASQADLNFINESSTANIITSKGAIIPGKVIFIGKVADPLTQTFPVEIEIKNAESQLRIGESIVVEVQSDTPLLAHYIPKSSLVLDSQGRIGVKTLSPDGIVMTKSIDIIDEEVDGFLVDGLSDEEYIITMGAAFVVDGEKIEDDEDAPN
ncbi:MAG: transporter [Candidatus Midichloriaceae bacterium]|jgi:multidrug efflux system membrane fusion protein|nr:transporter [Candidatus Midichloriaceae bacterium]